MTEIYLLNVTEPMDEDVCRTRFPSRWSRSGKFRREEDRRRCVGVGVLLGSVLGLTEADVAVAPDGKPDFRTGERHFSVSHSGDLAVLAVGNVPLGVDVERPDRAHLSVAEKILTPDEAAFVREDELPRFFTVWTLKESLSKVSGRGLGLGFDRFSVMPMLAGHPVTVDGAAYFGQTQALDGYTLSVTTLGEKPDAVIIRR